MRLRRRSIDFISQNNIGEDRAGLEFEFVEFRIVDRNTQNVGRQQIAGELDAVEFARQTPSERMSQSCFSNTGDVFDEKMPLRKQRKDGEFDGLLFPFYGLSDGIT